MPRILVLAVVLAARLAAQDRIVEDHLIIIIGDPPQKKPEVVAAAAPPPAGEWMPQKRDEIYAAVWKHPEQDFVDSDIGMIPLWVEPEYDANGNPKPRFPDIWTKQLMANPTRETAVAYLAGNRARWQRYHDASAVMRRTAAEIGYVNPESFAPPEYPLDEERAVHHMRRNGYTKDDVGTPIMTAEQARFLGLHKEEIPYSPGKKPMPVEVILVWDWRDTNSLRAIGAFARWGKDLNIREIGPRFMTISVDNDGDTLQKQLDFVDYMDDAKSTRFIENWTDTTDLITTMRIRVTPTYLLINRKTGKVIRFEGVQQPVVLKNALMELVGKTPEDYDRMDPTWFRDAEIAYGSTGGVPEAGAVSIPNASPIQPPTKRVAPWMPNSGWIEPTDANRAPVKP